MNRTKTGESKFLSEVNTCPKCGKPMILGKISADGLGYGWGVLTWIEEKKGTWRKHGEWLEDTFNPKGLKALRCKECRIILCYENPIPPDKPTPKPFLKKCVKCKEQIPIASEYCPRCGAKQIPPSNSRK